MRFDTSQQMRLGQQMKLAPRMIQSMEILQMPLLQLEERIEQELESNATLEVAEVEPGVIEAAREGTEADVVERDETPLSVDEGSGTDDFARLDSFEETHPDALDNEYSASEWRDSPREEYSPPSRARSDDDRDAKSEAMANAAARGASLTEQLLDQWRMVDVEDRLRPLGELLISHIEDDGYLRTPIDAIIDRMGADAARPDKEQMERALTAVQLLLEPPGIGARDVRECLLLQIDALLAGRGDLLARDPDSAKRWTLNRVLVADHLEDLSQNRLPKVAAKVGVALPELKRAMDELRILTLSPGRSLVQEAPSVIVPDAVVEFDEELDRYIVYLNDRRLPNLRVNQEYARMARDRTVPTPTRQFLKKNLTNASWLMDAVEQRRKTLLRVLEVVVAAQREYFDFGPQSLKPLPMTQVADQLGIHVATVSRAVADKYVQTPRGVVPLRGFFSGGTQTESGENVSWDAVRAALKEVIDQEDKRNPLSDDALAEEVKRRGIDIARRTVAKYRDQLGVPTARLRKEF